MNVKYALIAVITLILSSTTVLAEDGFGVGIIVGEPTGFSVKKWIGKDRAIDGAAAWSLSGDHSLQIHADYLFHNFDLIRPGNINGRLPVYFGIGGRTSFNDSSHNHDTLVGVRLPVGISYLPAKAPVEMFIELAPIMDIVPSTDLEISAALGIRYYFR